MSKESKDNAVRVFPETFKQFVFDTAMRVSDMDKEGIQHALLNLVNRYEIGPTWTRMSEGKPASGGWYFILLAETAGIAKTEYKEPLLGKRIKGGFQVGPDVYYDRDIWKYAPAIIPKDKA